MLLLSGIVLGLVLLAAAAWWLVRPRTQVPGGGQRGDAASAAIASATVEMPADDWALPLVELAGLAPASGESTAYADVRVGTERALAAFAAEPQRLPRRPQLLPQLLGTLNDEEASGRQIAALITRDPALAATLLRLANSSTYRVQRAPVESVERAVALIGTNGLRGLVAVALMQPVMRTEGGLFGRLPELIWEHTQHATVVAQRLAEGHGEDVFAAQLLVLLQGLGAIVVVQTLRDECQRSAAGIPPAQVTADLLRRGSPRIARLLAGQWQLSPRLLEALDGQGGAGSAASGSLGQVLAMAGAQATAAMLQAEVAN